MKPLLLLTLCIVIYNGKVEALMGGTAATLGQYPAHVSLLITNTIHCGGTIIGAQQVLTAGHCCLNAANERRPPTDIVVRAGVIQVNPAPTPIAVAAIYVHPEYDPFNMINDICVIRTTANFTFPVDQAVPALDVAPLNNRIRPLEETCFLVGFNPPAVTALQVLASTLHNSTVCSEMAQGSGVRDNMLCTTPPPVNVGACEAARGGGLYCDGYVTGILSQGFPCGTLVNVPAVYTDIRFFSAWIGQQLVRTDVPAAGPTPPPGVGTTGGSEKYGVSCILLLLLAALSIHFT